MVAPSGVEGPAGFGGARGVFREGGGAARGDGLCLPTGLCSMCGGRPPTAVVLRPCTWPGPGWEDTTFTHGRNDAAGAMSPSQRTHVRRTADTGTEDNGVWDGVARPLRVK